MSDEQAIRDLVTTWMKATRDGDIPAALDLMTDDIVFMVPGQKPFGKKEFAAGSEAMQGASFEGDARIEELQLLGDWAFIRNFIEVSITLPGEPRPMRKSGYTLSLLRKCPDGRWRLCRDANLVTERKS